MLDEGGVARHGLLGQISGIHARLHLLQRRLSVTEEQRELLVGAIDQLHALADQVRAAIDDGLSRAASGSYPDAERAIMGSFDCPACREEEAGEEQPDDR